MKVSTLPTVAVATAILFATVSSCRSVSDPKEVKLPKVDHILIEVKDLNASIGFYRDFMGLKLTSNKNDWATLKASNTEIYLWQGSRDWEAPRSGAEQQCPGMYPHLEVANVVKMVEEARKRGYKIPQEARKYSWGTEAFVTDPDGYTWALFSWSVLGNAMR